MENISPTVSVKWDPCTEFSITTDVDFVFSIRRTNSILTEPIGTPRISRRQNKVLVKPFLINKYDTCYLYEK